MLKLAVPPAQAREATYFTGESLSDVLLYPASTEKSVSIEPHASLIERFRSRLREASLIIAIGHSFRDAHRLLGGGLRFRRSGQRLANLGSDPEMKYTAAAAAVASFSLAVNKTVPVEGGEPRALADWFNIVCWGKLAEIVAQHLQKGARVYLEGRMATRTWVGDDGQKRYRTEVIASNCLFLDGKRIESLATEPAPQEVDEELPFADER